MIPWFAFLTVRVVQALLPSSLTPIADFCQRISNNRNQLFSRAQEAVQKAQCPTDAPALSWSWCWGSYNSSFPVPKQVLTS